LETNAISRPLKDGKLLFLDWSTGMKKVHGIQIGYTNPKDPNLRIGCNALQLN